MKPERPALQLYLVRHAHALDGENDAARPLSHRGREQVRAMAALLSRGTAFQPAEIWHSPLARAAETASLLARELRSAARLREVPGLEPHDDPAALVPRINGLAIPVAIVGHEPHLSALATLLIDAGDDTPAVVMKKCAILACERTGPRGRWMLRWLVSPELLA